MFTMLRLLFLLSLLALQSIRYEIISDLGVYTIPYSLHTVLIMVLNIVPYSSLSSCKQ